MKLSESAIHELLQKSTWSDGEKQQLLALLEGPQSKEVFDLLQKEYQDHINENDINKSEWSHSLLDEIHQKITPANKEARVFYMWKKYVAAACVIAILFTASYYLIFNKSSDKTIALETNHPQNLKNDIAPGGNKAILTLADGSTVILDSAQNGMVSTQGNSRVIKLKNGLIAYNSLNEKPVEIVYNTITTPRGGQYQLTLSDGSQVWLNAASSITFPTSFSGSTREVKITGEAYFEVAHNAAMPFRVLLPPSGENKGSGVIEVLGTHFNINAYEDEGVIKTTLLQGSVKVSKGNSIQMLSPGQQAQLFTNGQIRLNKNPEMEEVMAWKNGKFIFTGNSIQSVMRQLERWYDITVVYKGETTKEEFVGGISRNVSLSKTLNMLSKTQAVNFEINNRTIIVK